MPTLTRSASSTLLLILSLLMVPAIVGQAVECPPGCSQGRWTNDAVDLSTEPSREPEKSRDIVISAPDHRKVARILNDHWWIEDSGKKIVAKDPLLYYPAEFAWAPDSSAFFITTSPGYTTGYEIYIYRIVQGKIISIGGINRKVRIAFEHRHRCFDGDTGNDPNIVGLKWLKGSEQILVVAEVPPLGICSQADYFGGYEISLSSGRILRRFSPEELAVGWSQVLGESLVGDLKQLSPKAKSTLP